MDKKIFINQIQEICIDESVAHDIKLLATCTSESLKDFELVDLAALMKNSDQQSQDTIGKLMYFSAKNSIAALLHLIDMQFTLQENTDEFSKTELLDIFLQRCGPEKKAVQ